MTEHDLAFAARAGATALLVYHDRRIALDVQQFLAQGFVGLVHLGPRFRELPVASQVARLSIGRRLAHARRGAWFPGWERRELASEAFSVWVTHG